jgi:hypothetical protein
MTFFSLAKNTSGNASFMFAICAVPCFLAAGMAIDYSVVLRTRNALQIALDSATLASAASPKKFEKKTAMKFFEENGASNNFKINEIAFKKGDNSSTIGSLSAVVPTNLMGLVGLDSTEIALQSVAVPVKESKLTKVTFDITNAQGVYDKEIYFFTKDKDGKISSDTLMLDYNYEYAGGAGTKTFTPKLNKSKTITLGEYETFGERMVVYEDVSYHGKHINPKSYASDDKNASEWTKVTGLCDKGKGETQNWEDGGDKNYLDFVFQVKCEYEEVATGEVRLAK